MSGWLVGTMSTFFSIIDHAETSLRSPSGSVDHWLFLGHKRDGKKGNQDN